MRIEIARIEKNPPMPTCVIGASVPPTIIASQRLSRMYDAASPIAIEEAAQAVHEAAAGPRVPSSIEIMPEAMFGISIVIHIGLMPIGALAEEVLLGDVEGVEPADARRDRGADAMRLGMRRDVESRVRAGLAGRGDRHLHEAVGASRGAPVHADLGIELLDLAAEGDRQAVEVDVDQTRRAAPPGDDPAEARFAIEPERRDHADARDDHPSICCRSQRHRRITSPTHRRRREPHP